MKRADFQLARQIFAEVCDLPREQQPEAVELRAGGNSEVRQLVVDLLAQEARGGLALPTDGIGVQAAGAPKPAPLPERIGPYRVVRVCGHGGMGLVYEAEQHSPRRRVAIKMIRAGVSSKEALLRFRYETEILGRLQHPGIGQIFEAGQIDLGAGSQPYFVMEFIEGEPLTMFARAHDLSLVDKLALMLRVCEAVHYAHQRGVVHRDLKPDNIIVQLGPAPSPTPSSAASSATLGQPKILDFGIARATDADRNATVQTAAGQLIGTLPYMSPEQAAGGAAELDARSDLYSLGVVLFELLSDRLPYDFRGSSIPESTRTIQETPPDKLSAYDVRCRGDLDTIVGKCLEKEPDRRYAGASELAEDIRRYLAHEPILARPPSALYELHKFVRRNRALVGGVVATFVALVVGVVLTTAYAIRADANARAAEFESYRAGIAAANAVLDSDPAAARRYLEETPRDLRGWEWDLLSSRLERYVLTYEESPEGGPTIGNSTRLQLAAGGSRLLAAETAPQPGNVVGVWDAAGGRFLRKLEYDATVSTFAAGGLGATPLAVGLSDGRVALGDLDGGVATELDVATHSGVEFGVNGAPPARVSSLAWDPSGARLAIGTEYGAWLWSDEGLRRVSDMGLVADGMAFSPDGATLALCVVEFGWGAVHLHDTATLERRAAAGTRSIPEDPRCLAWGADGEELFVGTVQRLVAVLDGLTLERRRDLVGHQALVRALAVHPGTDRIASSSDDGTVRIWRGAECVDVATAGSGPGHLGSTIVFTPDGDRIAFLDGDQLRLWDLGAGRRSYVLTGHSKYVYEVLYSPDGSRLVSSAPHASEVKTWDPIRRQLEVSIDASSEHLRFRGGSELRIGDALYDFETGEVLEPVLDTLPARWEQFVRFHPWKAGHSWTGQVLSAEGSAEENVLVISDASGNRVLEVPGRILDAAAHPGGELLAVARNDVVEVWDLASAQRVRELRGHSGLVYCVAFHPGGTRLASGGNDGTIRLWDTRVWEQVIELRDHRSYVKSLDFHPDGSQLASASGDYTVRLWDTVPLIERERQARGETHAVPLIPAIERTR